MKTFYVGGARSGKSSLAAAHAGRLANNVCCIVTATESDQEMSARIAAHRSQRPESWRVIEEPVKLGAALRGASEKHNVILIDCLTLWTANCLWPSGAVASDHGLWQQERESFVEALRNCAREVIIVSNEVGTGIIPANAASRVFVDEQGWLNQAVAASCDEVYQAIAGIAVRIKPPR